MPNYDGTGPWVGGPMTGWGCGSCGCGFGIGRKMFGWGKRKFGYLGGWSKKDEEEYIKEYKEWLKEELRSIESTEKELVEKK